MSGSLASALDLAGTRHLGQKDGGGERADSFDAAEQLMIAGELLVRADLLGDEFFSLSAHFAFLSLAGRQPPFHYPAVQRRFRHRSQVAIRDVHPKPRWWQHAPPWPRTFLTKPVKWDYAAVMDCLPRETIPARASPSLRLRLQVSGAPAGVGLLNADRSAFTESERILPGIESTTVFLPVATTTAASQLVVHTWDVPDPARVVIEDIAFVW